MKKALFFIFIIISMNAETLIIFVHPSTIFGICSENFLPAIQNLKLRGLHKISKKSIQKKCYKDVFIPFLKNYNIFYKNNSTSFYIFSWNGNIYPVYQKKIASVELFKSLSKIKNKFDKIILIGCSHGGSVILGMAPLLQKNKITIDSIILLGTPISTENNNYALLKIESNTYVFKKIINVYSNEDYIQKTDFIFNNYKFCNRTITKNENIINYEIYEFGHINLWHQYPWKDPFVISIPLLLKKYKI